MAMPREATAEPQPEEEEETVVLSDCEMSEEEEETDVFTDWAMEETAVFPDWAMLDRIGRTRCHKDLDAARLVVSKNKTAARLRIDRGLSCYVSFTLAAPEGVSYLNLHWPVGEGSDAACSFVRATDKDLVLFDIYNRSRIPYLGAPADLFVYTAAGPSPSVQQLPLYPKEGRASWRFLRGKFTTGILRLSKKRYVVADLSVLDAALCVFNSSSQTKQWKTMSITPGLIRWHPPQQNQNQNQSSGQLPDLWSTDDVLAFDDRFLCWVDYFSGVLLSDFSSTLGSSVALHFVPFPGEKEYPEDVPRQFPGRFRNVSITQGKVCFVHIDNDFHETFEDDDCPCLQLPKRRRQPQQHLGPKKITIWTLNSNNFKFKWEQHGVINLDLLWAQPNYKAPERLPEFPVFHEPDVLCCLLREEEFYGKGWMIMVDMKQANLRSCTRYVNRQSYCAKCVDKGCAVCEKDRDKFPNVLLLPTVFSKQFEKPTGMALDNDKVASLSRKRKLKSARFV